MTGTEVRAVRDALGLKQPQLAQLLGVHPVTVSRWETDDLHPSPYQDAMLQSFQKAAKRPGIGDDVLKALVTVGIIVALAILLQAAIGRKGK